MDSRTPPSASVLQHSLIAVVVPFLFIYSIAVVLIDGAFAQYGAAFFPPGYIVVLLVAGFAETIATRAAHRKGESGFLPRLRSALVVTVASGFLILLFYGDIGTGHIGIDRFNRWLSLILAILQWILTSTLTAKLMRREFVFQAVVGKDGEELVAAYTAHNHEAGEAIAGFRKIRVLTLVFSFVLFALLFLVLWIGEVESPPRSVAFFGLTIVAYTVIGATMNRYRDGMVAMGFGNTVSKRATRAKMAMALGIVVVCALAAWLATGRSSILPEQHLRDAINYLIEVSWRQPDMEPVKLPAYQSDQMGREIERLVEIAGELSGSSYRQSSVWRYLGYAIGGALGVGVLLLILGPVIRSLRGGVSLRQLLAGFVLRAGGGLRSALAAIRDFFRSIKRRGKAIRERVGELRREAVLSAAARRAQETRSPEAREERIVRAKALRLFLRFVKWAKRTGISFRTSLGPREYAERVAAVRGEEADAIRSVAELYEELVFSNHTNRAEVQSRLEEIVGALSRVR